MSPPRRSRRLIRSGSAGVSTRSVDRSWLGGFRLSSVWPAVAVAVDEDAEYPFEMAAVENEEPVEAFGSDGADEAFGDRVCLRRPDRRADDLDAFTSEHAVELMAELAVAIV